MFDAPRGSEGWVRLGYLPEYDVKSQCQKRYKNAWFYSECGAAYSAQSERRFHAIVNAR
jgi:hypothetical protein